MDRQADLSPRYWKLQNHIQALILERRLKDGDRIPSERELVRETGLALGTVKRALENLAREGMLERRHGSGTYVRDAGMAFRRVSAQKPKIIALLLPLTESVYAQLISAVESSALAHGYSVFVKQTDFSGEKEKSVIESLLAEGLVQGFIIAPGTRDSEIARRSYLKLKRRGVPTVLIDRPVDGVPLDSVVQDNRAGAALAVRHLVESGRRRVGFVGLVSDPSNYYFSERVAGCKAALEEFGIELRPEWIFHKRGEDSDRRQLREFLLARNSPDAMLALSDLNACETYKVLRGIGRGVPEDVALVGYDNTSFARFFDVPLTSVSVDKGRMGREAFELLLKRMSGQALEELPTLISIKPSLEVRESSARLKRKAAS